MAEMDDLVFVPLGEDRKYVRRIKQEDIEEKSEDEDSRRSVLRRVLFDVGPDKHPTVTSELLYISATQPNKLHDSKAEKLYTKERKLNMLFNTLLYTPEDLDSLFVVAVTPPRNYNVEVYARALVEAINRKLDVSEEIDQETIDRLQRDTYILGQFSESQEEMLEELKKNQKYIDFLMNTSNKIVITKKELDAMKVVVEPFKRNIDDLRNEYGCKMIQLKAVSPHHNRNLEVNVFANEITPHDDVVRLRFGLYIPGVIKKVGLPMLEPSYTHLEMGLAAIICALTYPDKKIMMRIDITDSFGNSTLISVSEKSIKNIVSLTDNTLQRYLSMPSVGYHIQAFKTMKHGILSI